ncbi:MAG: VRR-NUC domain-containing protein [Lachnospiraceae bacterium]|nr:VRR-NUC domain-containing protein [Lachnospiraceae bacterium]
MNLKYMKRGETTEQIRLFDWARKSLHVLPCLELMYHVPNEGKRTNGDILKAAGMKAGVPDVCLPVSRKGYHGLYIEMKYGKNTATAEQEDYMALLRQQGYKTAVCYGFEEAKTEILGYLQVLGKVPLEECINAPWINGKCEGVQIPGQRTINIQCRECPRKRKESNKR